MTRETYTGTNCTGNEGDINRTLTLSNTNLSANEEIFVDGFLYTPTTQYTISHNTSSSAITFLIPIYNAQTIIVFYDISLYVTQSGAVSSLTIRRDIYRAFYGMISSAISDTQSPARSVNDFCFASFPDVTRLDKSDFPIVVFGKPTLNVDRFTVVRAKVNFLMNIDIYSAGDKAAENNNAVADNIYSIFNSNRVTTLRNIKGLHRVELQGEDEDTVMFQGIKTHVATLTFGGWYVHS